MEGNNERSWKKSSVRYDVTGLKSEVSYCAEKLMAPAPGQ
jgi:hypothetical protein